MLYPVWLHMDIAMMNEIFECISSETTWIVRNVAD